MKTVSFLVTNFLFSILAVLPLFFIMVVLNLPVNSELNERIILLFILAVPVLILFLSTAGLKKILIQPGLQEEKEVYNLNILFVIIFFVAVLAVFIINIILYSSFFISYYFLVAIIILISHAFIIFYLFYSKYRGSGHPVSIVTVMLIPFITAVYLFSLQSPCSAETETAVQPVLKPSPKTLIMCIDGLSSNILDPYMEENQDGFFHLAASQGVYAGLETLFPTHSPVIWTTIASGMPPVNHGVLSFGRYRLFNQDAKGFALLPKYAGLSKYFYLLTRAGLAGFYPNMSWDIKEPRIWDIMSNAGYEITVVNYPVSLPPSVINGFFLSETEFMTNFRDISYERVYPKAMKSDTEDFLKRSREEGEGIFKAEYMPFINSRDKHSIELAQRFFLSDYSILKTAEYIRSVKNPSSDADIVYIHGLDGNSHLFYGDYFSEIRERKRASDTYLGRYLRFIEDWMTCYIEEHDEDIMVFIFSDHGFVEKGLLGSIADPFKPYLQGIHENAPAGVFMAWGEDIDRESSPDNLSVYDILPTLLYYYNLPISREFKGNVMDIFALDGERKEIESYRGIKKDLYIKEKEIDEKSLRKNEEMLKSLGYMN